MPLYFQRPENALKRANEFIDVGEKQWALDALYDVIKSRKHRTWQKIHEPIMTKYLELCVELKKSHIAKEGLFQYRNICQSVNIKSLEDVVRNYLELAEQKTEAAREISQQAVVDIDDLDLCQSPESLLLSAVSSEDTQDRTDRVMLNPYVKFLWESYRQCLELLRNNSRVERLYHNIAQQAFRFCLKYNRKTEFRKLCDNLRAHLGHICKHQNQLSINLNNPDSQAMHLETRLVQLDIAIQMELFQEAYKAIEDIHGLMNLSKKAPNPRLMANYYQKLSLVFWKSNNYLFHAASLFRLFYLSREQKKNITSDEILRMASRVSLATLAIPMPPNRNDIDKLVETDENVIDKNHKLLSTLLGLPNPPTRALLIKDLVRFGIIQCSAPQVQDIYMYIETEFHPLKLCGRVQQSIDFIKTSEEFLDLRQYIPSIQDITVVRFLNEISQVYESIKFSTLLELVPFIEPFSLEYLVVEVARRHDLKVRIDHRKEYFHFGSDMDLSSRTSEIIEGPKNIQSMSSEQMRNQLVFIHSILNKAVHYIQPDKIKNEREELCKEIVKTYTLTSMKDHMRILNRQQIIEERKELLENINNRKEAEERKMLEDKEKKLREAEKERMAKEAEERSKERLLKEKTELRKKVVMEKIQQLKKSEIGLRIFQNIDEEELEKLDPDDLLHKEVEQLDKERKELQTKLKKKERKVDHLERAKRLEEIPLLKAEYLEHKTHDFDFWQQHEMERIKALKAERAAAVQHRDRLIRLKADSNKFLERLKISRAAVHQENMAKFTLILNEEKKRRLDERKQKRKEERRVEWYREQELKRKLLAEEKKKLEEQQLAAKLDEIEAKKRAKEQEIMEKRRLEEEKEKERIRLSTVHVPSLRERLSDRDSFKEREKPLIERERERGNWRERGGGGGDRETTTDDREPKKFDWRKKDPIRDPVSEKRPDDTRKKLDSDWRSAPRGDRERLPERRDRDRDMYRGDNFRRRDDRDNRERAAPPETGSWRDRDNRERERPSRDVGGDDRDKDGFVRVRRN